MACVQASTCQRSMFSQPTQRRSQTHEQLQLKTCARSRGQRVAAAASKRKLCIRRTRLKHGASEFAGSTPSDVAAVAADGCAPCVVRSTRLVPRSSLAWVCTGTCRVVLSQVLCQHVGWCMYMSRYMSRAPDHMHANDQCCWSTGACKQLFGARA